jgi:O-acetyl-ADP-ribose deacetylase
LEVIVHVIRNLSNLILTLLDFFTRIIFFFFFSEERTFITFFFVQRKHTYHDKYQGHPMEQTINASTLVLIRGDITKEKTDAIVNAANSSLAGGGGVDGAIHRAGGPTIMQECRKIRGCQTGQAVITTGGNLSAKYVIHTVGPRYHNGTSNEAALLRSAYYESLRLASKNHLKSIAFPAISTGAYGYPLPEAAQIALQTIIDYLTHHQDILQVRFVLYDQHSYEVFTKELQKISPPPAPQH